MGGTLAVDVARGHFAEATLGCEDAKAFVEGLFDATKGLGDLGGALQQAKLLGEGEDRQRVS